MTQVHPVSWFSRSNRGNSKLARRNPGCSTTTASEDSGHCCWCACRDFQNAGPYWEPAILILEFKIKHRNEQKSDILMKFENSETNLAFEVDLLPNDPEDSCCKLGCMRRCTPFRRAWGSKFKIQKSSVELGKRLVQELYSARSKT